MMNRIAKINVMPYARYAIYYTPPPGPLSKFGAAWLGWDMGTGDCPEAPDIDGLPAPAHDLSRTPRKYGFHGTIKPPFHLAKDESVRALDIALAAFSTKCAPITLGGLELTRLGSFLALVPYESNGALQALATRVVKEFDPFRAPLTDQELERRRSRPLSDRQNALLEQWGYPYVMEEFRFHMTLTGRLPKADAKQAEAALIPTLAPILPTPFRIDSLTLCGEDHNGMFHSLSRYSLTGKPSQNC